MATFADEMIKQKDNPNRMAELENTEKKPGFWQRLKDKLVASDNDMQKMTENRADVQGAKQRSMGANQAYSRAENIVRDLGNKGLEVLGLQPTIEMTDVSGLRKPVQHTTVEQAMNNETLEPAKTEGGSVLADLVDKGAADDTFLSGAMGGMKDDKLLTTEEKRKAEGLGPESFRLGDESNAGGETSNAGGNNGGDSGDTSGSNTDNGLSPQEQIAEDSAMKQWQIAQKVLDEQNPYKSGADYLKALWGNGAKGKAQAVGNVLGNLLGAVGSGVAGKDYKSDWQQYKDEYAKQSQERRAEAAKNAQDMVNTIAQNKESRAELVNALMQAKEQGANLTTEDMIAIQNWQTATQPSSALNKAIASLVQSVKQQGLFGTGKDLLIGIAGGKKN